MKKYLYLLATDQVNGSGPAVLKAVLRILSMVYAFLLVLRKAFYKIGIFRCHRLEKPVISVGNLTVGGVGKTPLVAYIAQALRVKGVQPVILTRGYMAGDSANSDEAAMLEKSLADVPVLVGADRVKSAKIFLEENRADVFLLDDGFQHWRLSRDLDIVVIDATNPWGNGHLLPRGIMRESKKALLRAHIFVLSKADLGQERLAEIEDELKLINPNALIIGTVHQPVSFRDMRSETSSDLIQIDGKRICAVCSIGAPDSFVRTLGQLRAEVAESLSFMDHHHYSEDDVKDIIDRCRQLGVHTIVVTEKDAVKVQSFIGIFPEDISLLSLKIEIVIRNGEETFLERIHRLF